MSMTGERVKRRMYRTSVKLPSALTFTKCLQLGLRGYNKAGLSSTIYRNIIDCEAVNPRLILPNIVIDAVGDYDGFNVRNVELAENAHWKHSDAEYTRSADKLSAVWPTLRHGRYEWKIVKHDPIGHNQEIQQSLLDYNYYNSYDCGESEVLACGETQANFINVENLQLHHGYRYYVCVHAEATRKEYEKTELLLPETSACSDGIVVDQTPPTHGNVWIGSVKQRFQITTSELVLNWDDFYDVEEHGRTKHSSGIRKYDVAIGTSPGGVDVLDFDDVGITNWAVVHDLQLQGGQTYYATVRATDFVGLSSDVVSDGVTVDVTPPMKTDKTIDVGGAYLTSVSAISAKWNGVFEDQESGIDHYEWCIGSRPGFADVFPCIVTMEPEINDANFDDLTLKQGHTYYVTVTAYNGAGLSTTASSGGVVVDSSPPEHGMVYDGQSVEDDKDLDYQTRLDSLTARWKGFHEPHTDIVGYSWKIGTSPGYDDILEEEFVGLVTEMSASDLNLQPGVRYYTTVTACNAAELCTTVSSDGIIADNSPPVAGIVYDGISDGDHAYQASRTAISAHWFNFHDPHTQLSHYEWLAGTIPGGDNVMASTRLHLTERAFTSQLQQPLPLNVPIYVTVRAYNKAGLFTEAASNGIIVDNSPPETVTAARLDVNEGSITPETQIWRSMLRVSWAFSDPDSQIEHHRLSVFTHHQSDMSVLPVKTTGGVHHHVFTNLTLHDGDTYSVKVIACNGAKLCSMSESPGILVDSSPPSVGTFAVATDHAAGLSRHRQSWMTYLQGQGSETAKVNLAWLGFVDIHSGIRHYFVTLGTSFAARDLTDDQAVRIQYVHGSSHLDEGVVQTASIPVTRDLHPGEHIYCALWAINGVGLRSYEAHETFVVVKSNNLSGVLSLLRRCDSQTCEGDCTCAPQNQLCHDSTVECNDVTGDGQYEQVDVVDVLDYHDNEADLQDQDVDYTPSACTIAAKWKNTDRDIPIQRYEWTVGSKGGIPGSGLLNPAKDRIWHDAGMRSFAVFSLRSGNLHPDVEYVFYVRAWYDDRTFAVFQSDGVIPDFTVPSISTSRKVKDLADLTNLVDIDYSNDLGTLRVSWKNVFPSTSGLSHFMVSISTVPQGEDITPYNSTVFSVSEYKGMITNLSLRNNHKYYMNVMAVSLAGLHSIASSDGILIDTTEPASGRVDDGLGVHDADHQNSSTLVSASWYGFSDLQSSIHHYKWCVGSQPGLEDIFPCRDVGLHLSMSVELDVPMTSGTHYYSKVSAMDAVGLESQAAVSNGVLVDTTPPQNILKFVAEGNLLRNPSFEEALGQDENTVKRNCTINASSTLCLPKDWQVNGTGYVVISAGSEAQLEDSYLIVHGTVSQTIETTAGDKYKFSIYINHLRQFTVPLLSQEGFIQIPGIHRVFKLYQRNGNHGNNGLEWYEHIYYFTAESDSTTVTIGSLGRRNGIAVDNARIQHLAVHVDGEVYDGNEQPSCISLHSRTNGRTHSVSASWNILDTESPIVEYLWAIGTVKGGTQVQSFKSVGRSSHAFADDLLLSHGIPIHVTVTARNAADLRSVFYSQPMIVDVTAPNICCIKDGAHIGKDLTHQTSSVISVQWNVSDPESKVEFCEWALGFSPGSGTLKPFTVTDDLAFVEESFAGLLNHGQTIYATVRCKNFAGLYNQITSNGVTIVQEGPRSEEATVRVVSSSPSMFETRGNHQASTDNINVIWNGFSDLSGISHYECRVLGDGSSNMGNDWRGIGEDGQMAAMLSGINLESYKTYQVQIRAVNHVGLKSDVMSSNVTIETNAPVLTGENIQYTWSASDVVTIRWNNVFKNNSTLIYHLTISTLQGGSDIIKWFETRVTSYDFLAADKSRSYFVSIMAVNEAGLYDTLSGILSYV
ncbi:uncharacterized protein [Ptychodera flava]|uniref:uncharacterized protein n=1 Tax=Ptychodera flava TaxID=63121 RepID=UPI00396A9F33